MMAAEFGTDWRQRLSSILLQRFNSQVIMKKIACFSHGRMEVEELFVRKVQNLDPRDHLNDSVDTLSFVVSFGDMYFEVGEYTSLSVSICLSVHAGGCVSMHLAVCHLLYVCVSDLIQSNCV